MIELPDIRQKDGWSCGPTAAAIVLTHLEVPVPKSIPIGSPVDGTDPLALVSFFRQAGLAVQAGEMTLDDLAHHTKLGRPVICLMRDDGDGHYVVVAGVERRRRVLYQCPAYGPKAEPVGRFGKRWWDQGRDCRYEKWGVAVYWSH
jgi:ABC-type bacteriocin/lantibiotic exporter with double-glycine peptidase domain